MPPKILQPIVLIDGVDQSSKLTGDWEIEIEESMARVASFSLLTNATVAELIAYANTAIVMKTVLDGVTKTEFTGVIGSPKHDIFTGITLFECSDNMQEHFEPKTKAEIDVIISAYWSEAFFNDSDGWAYALERMSTIPSALDMDELNNVRITPWEAKETADYTFNAHIEGSLNLGEMVDRRNIINAINISLDYRYTRLKERQLAYDLDDGIAEGSWVCENWTNPRKVPQKQRVVDAINTTGWELLTDITYIELPPSGLYEPCGVAFATNPAFCRGAAFTIGSRYSQNVTEKYTIRVESADSIENLGEIAVTKTGANVTEYDLTAWNESKIADGWTDFGTPLVDINGDNYANQDSDTDRQNAIDTIVNLAKTEILKTHRGSAPSWDVPYIQDIDVIHTAEHINSALTVKGKIKRLHKTINIDNMDARVKITLAASKKYGVGIPGTENPPATPDGLPTVEDTQTVDIIPAYHLGGQDPTVYEPNWAGWITDYNIVTEPGHVPYPTEFVVNTPAITLNSIDNIEPSDSSLINVTIPDDTLI